MKFVSASLLVEINPRTSLSPKNLVIFEIRFQCISVFSILKDNISNEVIFADSWPRSCSKIFWYVLYADDSVALMLVTLLSW